MGWLMGNVVHRWKAVGLVLVSVAAIGLTVLGLVGGRHSEPEQAASATVETDLRAVDESHSGAGHSDHVAWVPAPLEGVVSDFAAPQIPAVGSPPPEAVREVEAAQEDSSAALSASTKKDDTKDGLADAPQGDRQDGVAGSDAVAANHYPVDDWLIAPPTDPRELISFALYMHVTGHFADAERLLMAIQLRYPDQPATYEALGDVYRRLGEYDKAIGQYATLRAVAPQELQPVLGLTDSQIDAGYTGDALAELCVAIGEYPHQPDLQLQMMRALDQMGGAQALTFAQNWVAQEQDNRGARQILAALYASGGHYQEALAGLDYLAQNDSKLANVQIYKAIVLEDLGLTAEALAARETAVASAPQNATFRLGLALLLIKEGQTARAAEQIQAAVDLNPGNIAREPAMQQLALAQTSTRDGQPAKAAEQLQAALDAMPKNGAREPAMEQLALAQVFSKEGQPPKAPGQTNPTATPVLPEDSRHLP
jgi:tetratricopeptide (TPR) repeat protein